MSTQPATIVQRLWNYCNVLRDDGMSYGDYVEQLTYLLFLKMDAENVDVLGKTSAIPTAYSWASLAERDGDDLETHCRQILQALGQGSGLIPVIFRKAQNKIRDPAKLKRLIDLIEGETWIGMDIDIKGEIYEGLLEKNAQDTKSGAGQYFTPRPLIKAIVDVMQPQPGQTLCDPAGGTGGFILAVHDYVADRYKPLTREQWDHLRHQALYGWEIVDNTARLCVMNLYLHGIGGNGSASPIRVADSLASHPGEYFDLVLTNPPFGKKSSVTFVTDEGEVRREAQTIVRDDFWTSTSNKQLNFVQHVRNILKQNGRAAIVVPDNVLFFDRKPASATPWTQRL
jgi:type I restriction enzyme M protein